MELYKRHHRDHAGSQQQQNDILNRLSIDARLLLAKLSYNLQILYRRLDISSSSVSFADEYTRLMATATSPSKRVDAPLSLDLTGIHEMMQQLSLLSDQVESAARRVETAQFRPQQHGSEYTYHREESFGATSAWNDIFSSPSRHEAAAWSPHPVAPPPPHSSSVSLQRSQGATNVELDPSIGGSQYLHDRYIPPSSEQHDIVSVTSSALSSIPVDRCDDTRKEASAQSTRSASAVRSISSDVPRNGFTKKISIFFHETCFENVFPKFYKKNYEKVFEIFRGIS